MHRQLKGLLGRAYGTSELAIAVTVDIRGFTEFCRQQESPAVAHFLKRVYLRMVNDYYKKPRFFKPTGDGLLIMVPYTEQNLPRVATATVLASVKLVEQFSALCEGDQMVNFPTPDRVGIGISRGPVCALVAGIDSPKTIDYSGRYLNLSSRLTDMARPAGVVFDSAFGIGLLPDPLQKLFAEESVYVRSVAEREPIRIHYTKEYTEILPVFKNPMDEPRWRTYEWESTLARIEKSGPDFSHALPSRPADKSTIQVTVTTSMVEASGKQSHEFASIHPLPKFEYNDDPTGPAVILNHAFVGSLLRGKGVKGTWPCKVRIAYHEKTT